jgi:hypothetical protein
MKMKQMICAPRGTVQYQTKVFYFVALKFAGLPDNDILTNNCSASPDSMLSHTEYSISKIIYPSFGPTIKDTIEYIPVLFFHFVVAQPIQSIFEE